MEIPEAYAIIFDELPRQGPGSEASTMEAIKRLPPLPDSPRVVDVGCGTGAQTLVLASELRTRVEGIDLHQPYLDELMAIAQSRGIGGLISTRKADMGALDFDRESIDLIWSEGAIYIIGFEEGLRSWRRFLKPGGLIAASHVSWLKDDRPAEVEEFWAAEYPDIDSVEANIKVAESAGYDLIDHFAQPASNWWDEYYSPLSTRIEKLKPGASGELAVALEATEHEIDIFRRFSDYYGYVFFLLKKSP